MILELFTPVVTGAQKASNLLTDTDIAKTYFYVSSTDSLVEEFDALLSNDETTLTDLKEGYSLKSYFTQVLSSLEEGPFPIIERGICNIEFKDFIPFMVIPSGGIGMETPIICPKVTGNASVYYTLTSYSVSLNVTLEDEDFIGGKELTLELRAGMLPFELIITKLEIDGKPYDYTALNSSMATYCDCMLTMQSLENSEP